MDNEQEIAWKASNRSEQVDQKLGMTGHGPGNNSKQAISR